MRLNDLSSTDQIPLTFRDVTNNDLSLVFDSWLKEYRLSPFGVQVESDVYYPNYRKHVGRIIRASDVTIACNPEDEDQIYGYAVHRLIGDIRVVSWLFVKAPFRAMGIGRRLFDEIGGADAVTHLSNWVTKTKLMTTKPGQIKLPNDIVYNPFLDLFLTETLES
jgi:GNAT superfamily N-acetyltransferase